MKNKERSAAEIQRNIENVKSIQIMKNYFRL